MREPDADKLDYTLATDGPLFDRYVIHMNNGAKKYAPRNWMKAATQEELDRFVTSAFRHFMQWYYGEVDEDHAAAVIFNMNGAELVREKLGPLGQHPRPKSVDWNA